MALPAYDTSPLTWRNALRSQVKDLAAGRLFHTKRTAHFERWLFWARELYLQRKIDLNHIKDEGMVADALSKVTDRAKFLKCRMALLNL